MITHTTRETLGPIDPRDWDELDEPLRAQDWERVSESTPPPFEGAPARPLSELDEREITELTPAEFASAYVADGCEGCENGPRYACEYRMHCDVATYGVG